MKKAMRVLCFVIAVFILPYMSGSADFSFEDEENKHYYEMLDFQEISHNTTFPSAASETELVYRRNSAAASVYNNNGYSYLNYYATGDNANHGMQVVKRFKHTYTADDTIAYFTFTARVDSTVERRIWFYTQNSTDLYFYLSRTGNGAFEFTNTKIGTVSLEPFCYDDGDWHTFDLVFHLASGYLNLYVDEKPIAATAESINETPYNIPLKDGFSLYEARFSAVGTGEGWNIDDIQVSNSKDIMPGIVSAKYDTMNMVTLAANGECQIKYATGATKAEAVTAFETEPVTYLEPFAFTSDNKYVVAQATNTTHNITGPISSMIAEPATPIYEVDDFRNYLDGATFLTSNQGGPDANGFLLENSGGSFASVYNDGKDSYIKYMSGSNWTDGTYRIRKNFKNPYYSDMTVSFRMRANADDTTSKRIRFGVGGSDFDIYLYGDKDFTFSGNAVSNFPVADGNWHRFEFLFHAEEKFYEVKFDGEKIATAAGSTQISLPVNYTAVTSISWGNFAGGGFELDDIQAGSVLDGLPGIVTYNHEFGQILLSTEADDSIKYAIAGTATAAKEALEAGGIQYTGGITPESGQYIAACAYNTEQQWNGGVKIYGPLTILPVYICDDFSNFEHNKQIPASGNYNGYSMDNYGDYAKVYNDGKDSYIIHTSTAQDNTNNANSGKRLVRTFEKSYSNGNVRVRFSWKTGSAKRKNITVGPLTLHMTETDSFRISGFPYPEGTTFNTAYVERFDSCSDGEWHTFTFDFYFDEKYVNIYFDDMSVTPYNCYWTASAYGSNPAQNIPIAEDTELSFIKFCSYDKDEWFCIDNVQVSNQPDTMPSIVMAALNADEVTLYAQYGTIQYAIAETVQEAVSALKEDFQVYGAPITLTRTNQYIALRTTDTNTGFYGPMTVEGPLTIGNIYHIKYTTIAGNALNGSLSDSDIKLSFNVNPPQEGEPFAFTAATALYDANDTLVKVWINHVADVTEETKKEFMIDGISLDASKWKLKTLFLQDLQSLVPICEAYTEVVKVETAAFHFENGMEGWSAAEGNVYVTNRGYYDDDGSAISEKDGNYFLSTVYNDAGVSQPDNTAEVHSPAIKVSRDTMTFVAAGGDGDCAVSLCNTEGVELENEILNHAHFSRVVWNVAEYVGSEVYIKLVDQSSNYGVSIDAIRTLNGIEQETYDAASVEGYYAGYCSSPDLPVTAEEFICAIVRASGNVTASDAECVALAKSGNIKVGDTSASSGKVKFFRDSDNIDLYAPLTRGEAALMLSRLYDRDAQGDARRADPDVGNRIRYENLIKDYAAIPADDIKKAVVDVYALGFMTTRNGAFDADDYITGAESAGAIVRAFDSSKCFSEYVTEDGFYVPTVFGSNMVIQRNKPIHIWGQGIDGDTITVSLMSDDNTTVVLGSSTVSNGRWEIILDALSDTTKTYTMEISNGADTQSFTDILVGEVWVISGQSNMQTPVNAYMNTSINGNIKAEGEDASNYTGKIRYFTQAHSYSNEAKYEVRGGVWKECNTGNVWNFSATGYMFARELYDFIGVPVGLVYAAQGSTGIQTWMSRDTIASDQDVRQRVFENNQSAGGSEGKAPSRYYNAMVAPVQGLNIAGILWYQGESNAASDGAFYEQLLKTHINGWRNEFYEGANLPFIFMQLAPYTGLDYTGVREGMRNVSEELANVAMAVQIDWLDDASNPQPIHPYNKALVGQRLAKAAYGLVYGGGLDGYISPSYDTVSAEGNRVTVHLKHVGDGIKTLDGNAPTAFMVAGADGKYVQADAVITGTDRVQVWSETIQQPKYVRYAYGRATIQDNTQNNFVFSSTNLPLGPFEAEIH